MNYHSSVFKMVKYDRDVAGGQVGRDVRAQVAQHESPSTLQSASVCSQACTNACMTIQGLYLLIVAVTVYSHSGPATWGCIPRGSRKTLTHDAGTKTMSETFPHLCLRTLEQMEPCAA